MRSRRGTDRLDVVCVIGLCALAAHAEQSADGLPSDALAAGFAYRIGRVTLRRFFPIPSRLDEPQHLPLVNGVSVTGDICWIRLDKTSRVTVISLFAHAFLEFHMSIILDIIMRVKKTCGVLCHAGQGFVAEVTVVAPVRE